MRNALKLILINFSIVLFNIIISTSLYHKGITHDMTIVVAIAFGLFIFLLNLSYLAGLKRKSNDYYLPILVCLVPTLFVYLIFLSTMWSIPNDAKSEIGAIFSTMLIINIVLNIWPSFIIYKMNSSSSNN